MAAKKKGYTPAQYLAIRSFKDNPNLTMRELAENNGMKYHTASKLITRYLRGLKK